MKAGVSSCRPLICARNTFFWALSWHVAVSYPQHSGYTAFFQFSPDIQPVFPAFPLAEFLAKAFCRLFLWNFKEKSISPFLWPSFFYCLSGSWRHRQEVSCGYVRGIFTFGLPVSAKIFRGIPQKGEAYRYGVCLRRRPPLQILGKLCQSGKGSHKPFKVCFLHGPHSPMIPIAPS